MDRGPSDPPPEAGTFDLPPAPPAGARRWPPAAIVAVSLGGGTAALVLLLTLAVGAYLASSVRQTEPPAGVRLMLAVPPVVRVGKPATLALTVRNDGAAAVEAADLFLGNELLDGVGDAQVSPSKGSSEPLLAILKGRTYVIQRSIPPRRSLTIRITLKPRAAGVFSGLASLTLDGREVGRPVILSVTR